MPAEGVNGRANAFLGNHARSGAAARAGLRRHVPALDRNRRLDPRPRLCRVPRALAEAGAAGDARRRRDRQRDARARRADRRRRARPDDGAAARAARPARLVPRDRVERAPVPRLVGLRADHHRGSGVRSRRQGARLRGAFVALEARRGRHHHGARAARPGRRRAQVRAQVRGLGGRGRDALPRVVDPGARAPAPALARAAATAARSSRRWT